MPKIGVFFYSRGGNTEAMAHAVAEGCRATGAEVVLERVEHADPKAWSDLDGIILGSPTYFGNMCWEAKRLVDESVVVYQNLSGRTGGVFTSAGGRRDGERALQTLTWALEIHGMEVVAGGVLCEGKPSQSDLDACRDYGKRVAIAAGS